MTTPLHIDMPRVVVNEFDNDDVYDLADIFDRMKQAGQPWFNASSDNPESIRAFVDQALENQQDDPRHTYRMAIRHKQNDGSLQLIGYVSLCKIFGNQEGIPDTGIFVDPQFQRGGYAREARLGIMMFAFWIGLGKIYCDIAPQNTASITNVLGMGYAQHMDDNGAPKRIATETINGMEYWNRYALSSEAFFDKIPHLFENLKPRWENVCASVMTDFSRVVHPANVNTPESPWEINGLFKIKHGGLTV